LTINGTTYKKLKVGDSLGDAEWWDDMYQHSTGSEAALNSVLVDSSGALYIRGATTWYTIHGTDKKLEDWEAAFKKGKELVGFNTGGLADFTGPAWLDGTKSSPELVLNARDTENFIMLKDILAEIMSSTGSLGGKETKSGDNYFDISISVEEISDDYDVE
jgi:hypothetical protein